jgi:DNA polymerase alpha subunit A
MQRSILGTKVISTFVLSISLIILHRNKIDCYGYLSNQLTMLIRKSLEKYYDVWLVCDDPTCSRFPYVSCNWSQCELLNRKTRQQSVLGMTCTACRGTMKQVLIVYSDKFFQFYFDQVYTDHELHTQIKYLESLFDVARQKNVTESNKSEERYWICSYFLDSFDICCLACVGRRLQRLFLLWC